MKGCPCCGQPLTSVSAGANVSAFMAAQAPAPVRRDGPVTDSMDRVKIDPDAFMVMCDMMVKQGKNLSQWTQGFLADLPKNLRKHGTLTGKQWETFKKVYKQILGVEAPRADDIGGKPRPGEIGHDMVTDDVPF